MVINAFKSVGILIRKHTKTTQARKIQTNARAEISHTSTKPGDDDVKIIKALLADLRLSNYAGNGNADLCLLFSIKRRQMQNMKHNR